MKARLTNRQSVVEVSETFPPHDESLGHIEGDGSPAIASKESASSNLQGVVGCFIHVTLPPRSDLPRTGNVSGVVFTDEGGALLGHTVFPGSVPEASSWPYIGVGEPSPYSAQTNALRGFDIALEMKSIMGRFRFLNFASQILILGAIGLGALFQLGYTIP